ncbi:hypothetical protein [Actinokineospora sp. HUAS TT18]|uniref:hypothetical protein n=1 Tax=Actinokineospora sp. HUAS TT18 TaxID=3447451 RepID=UPI003F521339
MREELPPLPEFPIGVTVDVVGGPFKGDCGVVVRSPISMRAEFVLVALARANMSRFVGADCLRVRA